MFYSTNWLIKSDVMVGLTNSSLSFWCRNTVLPGIRERAGRTRHSLISLTSHGLLRKGGWTVELTKCVLRLASGMQRLSSLTFSKCLHYDLFSSLPFLPKRGFIAVSVLSESERTDWEKQNNPIKFNRKYLTAMNLQHPISTG